MAGERWEYFVPYHENIRTALDELRTREFKAGRYRHGGRGEDPQTPEEALQRAGDVGTRSILDMLDVWDKPDYHGVARVPREDLIRLFGTDKPTHNGVARNVEIDEPSDRDKGIYIIIYNTKGKPSEIDFAGYSPD